MSGVWEALFYEEKQDWITCVVSSVTSLLNLLVELPCTLLALLSSTLLLSWDYTCQGAQQVSDLLALEEWWTLEHTLWVAGTLYMLSWLTSKQKTQGLLVILNHIQGMCMWGSFIFLINGVQGGVPFGGKLFHPTMAVFAVLLQTLNEVMKALAKEIGGMGHDEEMPEGKAKTLFDIFPKAIAYEQMFCLYIAVFGLPKFDMELSDPASLLVILPVLGMVWDGKKWQAALEAFDKVAANGAPPQVEAATKEAAAAEPAAEPAKEEEAKAEEPKAEEKAADDKKEEEKKDGEAAPAPAEAAKSNPLKQAMEAVCGLVCKVVGMVKCAVNKIIDLICLVKAKILGLPWDCIITSVTSLGILAATAFAYWSLTEDHAALVSPALALLGPLVLSKMQEKTWLDAKGVHLGNEILATSVAVIQYHLFRTYIALPI